MGCCLVGCFRLLFWALWRAMAAALVALALARIDGYVEQRFGEHAVGRAWRLYRRRGRGDE